MITKLLKCICLGYFIFLTTILPAAEQAKTVSYILLRHSNNKNPVFVGLVKRSRSAKLSFLSYVQLTYVIPVNETVRGRIINTDGKVIRKGDILAEAQNAKEQILVNISSEKAKNAKQSLKDASLNLERFKKLYKRQVATGRQYEQAENLYLQARSDYDVCRLELLDAKSNLENKILRAPFSGVVEDVFAAAGSSLSETESVLVLSVFDPIYIKVKLHNILTDLIHINNKFLVYPTGMTDSYPAWMRTQDIFTDYIVLSAKNILIPKWQLTPEQKKLPKVYTWMRSIKAPEMPSIPLWVPARALKKDDKGSYVWATIDKILPQNGFQKDAPLTVKKVRVETLNMLIEKRYARYQALKDTGGLKDSQIILIDTEGILVDGAKAILQDECWLFKPTEKVWVSIPQLSKYMYTISHDALKTFDGRSFILVINKDNTISPVEVFVYKTSAKNTEIIGKELKPGMKIICSKTKGLSHLGQKVHLGTKINF